MRLKTVLKIIGVLVVALIVAVVAVISTVDVNRYKGAIEAQAEAATGRTLTIAGDLSLSIGFSPTVSVEGVRFANASWGSRPDMLSVERFEAQVALFPLIFGNVKVRRLILVRPDILLETDAQGTPNWLFAAADAPPAPVPPEDAAREDAAMPSLDIAEVRIESGRLTYLDGATGARTVLDLNSLAAEADSLGSPIRLDLDVAYNDAPITARGTVGALNTLLGNQAFPVDLSLSAGGADVALTGEVGEPMAGRGLDLALAVTAETLAGLEALTGTPAPDLGPLDLKTVLGGGGDRYTLTELDLRIGGSDLSGHIDVLLSGPRPKVTAALSSGLFDLADVVPPPESAPSPAPSPAPAAVDDGRVFPDDPLPLDGLRALDSEVELAVSRFVSGKTELNDVEVRLVLDNGRLEVDPLAAGLADGSLTGSLVLDARNASAAAIEAGLSVADLSMGALLQDMADSDLLQGGKTSLNVALTGSGASVRSIMAGLNGEVALVMDEGRIANRYVELAAVDLLSILAPWAQQQEFTVLNCAVTRFRIANGVAHADAIALDTERMVVTGSGDINLGTERLNLTVTPRPKEAILVSLATPIDIRGTLASPVVAPNPGAMVRGAVGGLAGVALLGPVGLLAPLVSTGSGSDNPCLQPAEGEAPATQEQPRAPASPVEGLDRAIRGLFGN